MPTRKSSKKTLRGFLLSNADLVDHYILLVSPTLRGQIDDEERRLWIKEDSYLRHWVEVEHGVTDL